jgi:FkbM family methyltransferase
MIKESIDKHLKSIVNYNFYPDNNVKSNISVLQNYIKRGVCVFEIGANDGSDIPLIHELWPDAEIHAFEIEPYHYDLLEKFKSDYIHVNNFGLYNCTGKVMFNRLVIKDVDWKKTNDYWLKSASSIKPLGAKSREMRRNLVEEIVELSVITIDEYCLKEACIPNILLIDTQGSEYEILEGAKKTLEFVDGILLEWSMAELYKDMKYLPEIEELLKTYGFKMREKIELCGPDHGDAIFTKE